jgi:hypothetical protein
VTIFVIFIHQSFLQYISFHSMWFCSQKIYEQTGTKATEIHSHHCLYCDTIFPQFDDLIRHSRENHPYHCYYCRTTLSHRIVEILYHSINNGGCGFLLLWFLFVRKFFGNKTGSSCCNIIHAIMCRKMTISLTPTSNFAQLLFE